MKPNELYILRQGLVQLVDMVPTENREAALAVQAMLLGLLGEGKDQSYTKKPRTKAGATIHVGDYGSVVCEDYTEAANYLGIGAGTLQVRLSQHKGSYNVKRQDPESGNPMLITVVRGKGPETHELAKLILTGKVLKPKEAKTEPIAYDKHGRITTNRLKRANPVENS